MKYTKAKDAKRTAKWEIPWAEDKAFDKLRATASSACREVNPDNPQAVAEAIPALYKALKLYQSHQQGTQGHYCDKCAEAIDKALARAEKK